MKRKLKSSHNDIRSSNLSLVLRIIREKTPISRADIAKETGVTRSTASSLVDELISLGYIEEVGLNIQNTVGKKATLLDIRTDKIFALAVNFTGNDIVIAKIDLKGECNKKIRKYLGEFPSEWIIEELISTIKNIIIDMKSKGQIFVGVGVAFPGPIANKKILFPASFKSLENCNLLDILRNEFNCPVYVENNADAAALAESWFGKYHNLKSLVFILIEQGIGCGIVINNELYHGHNKLTAELGHIIVKPDGPKCFCGNNGCLASLASDRAILRIVPDELLNKLSIKRNVDPSTKDILKIIDNLQYNYDIASKCIEEISYYLGIGIANIIDMFVPDIILIEGNLLKFSGFTEKVIQSTEKHVHPIFKNSFRIKSSQLGKEAPLIGAGTFLLKDLYFNPLKEFPDFNV